MTITVEIAQCTLLNQRLQVKKDLLVSKDPTDQAYYRGILDCLDWLLDGIEIGTVAHEN